MTDSKKEPEFYTVEREFLSKISTDEFIKCIIQSHILPELKKEAEEY